MPEYVQQVPDVQLDAIYSKEQIWNFGMRAYEDAAAILAYPTYEARQKAYEQALKARPYMYQQRPFMQAFIQLALEAGLRSKK